MKPATQSGKASASWRNALDTPVAMGLVAVLIAAVGMGSALWIQHALEMEPCPLCIFQRVAMIFAGLAGLCGALAWKGGCPRMARAAWAIGMAGAVIGVGMAARHMQVVWWPPEAGCGPDLEYLMEAFPPTKWVPSVFAGEAECSAAGSELVAGLPIPIWAGVAFLLQAAVLGRAWMLAKRGRQGGARR